MVQADAEKWDASSRRWLETKSHRTDWSEQTWREILAPPPAVAGRPEWAARRYNPQELARLIYGRWADLGVELR